MIELFDDFRDILVELHLRARGLQIPVIGRSALIKNKRVAGRPQDIADVTALGDAE